jgi:hypothetical protein
VVLRCPDKEVGSATKDQWVDSGHDLLICILRDSQRISSSGRETVGGISAFPQSLTRAINRWRKVGKWSGDVFLDALVV